MGNRINRLIVRAVVLTGACAAAWPAGAETFTGGYSVSFLGFPIARTTFRTVIEGDRFVVDGTVSSAGIAEIFGRTRGTASTTGRFAGAETRPSSFRTAYTEGRRKQRTELDFAGGTVSRNFNEPPLKKRGSEWVPVTAAQLQDVVDPLAAGLIKARTADRVCDRTLRIFDGEFRLDAVLSPVPTPRVASRKYGAGLVACRAVVKPVAGYRKGRRALDYLEKRSRIIIAFAPLGATGIYAPVHATVGTEIGTVTVQAQDIGSDG